LRAFDVATAVTTAIATTSAIIAATSADIIAVVTAIDPVDGTTDFFVRIGARKMRGWTWSGCHR
jgi:hypothetical protein